MNPGGAQKEPGRFTRAEIFSQPEAWEAALQDLRQLKGEINAFYQQVEFDQVIFTGCGSTYYLSLAAASLFGELSGKPARALPASELWLNPQAAYAAQQRYLLIAISRSGSTTETLRACQTFKDQQRGKLLTLSCYANQPLAGMGATNIVLPSGAERSVAQTRAFTTLYLATTFLAAIWSGQEAMLQELACLPQAGWRLLERYHPLAQQIGRQDNLERFYFLGSGSRYGLACELSLKMKEMTLSHSEAFHFLEFRHGPQSMVNPQTLLVGLVSKDNHEHEFAVLEEMRRKGGRILAIGEQPCDVSIDETLHPPARNLLYLPVGQLLAFERSIHRGLDPDAPHNLTAVVRLENNRPINSQK